MTVPDIVITGASSISSLGMGSEALKDALLDTPAVSRAREFEFHSFDTDIPCYRIPAYEPKEVLGKKGLRLKDWATKVLLGTIETNFKDQLAGYAPENIPGLCLGTAFGSVESIGNFLSDSIENGVNHVNPQLFANTVINSPTGNANIRYAIKTLSSTVATGFNAGLDALIYSSDMLKRGYYNAILAGGLEEISYFTLVGLKRSGVLSSHETVRPFAADGDGFLMGEGCAVFLLETEESAKARGATIIARIAGTGNTFDWSPETGGFNPRGEGALAAMRSACSMAGIALSDVDVVAASANGSKFGDTMEAALIEQHCPKAKVAAYKAKTGECYGGSGALATACALADMESGRISPVDATYPLIRDIDLVVGDAHPCRAEHTLINSFSCDGNCSSILLQKYN